MQVEVNLVNLLLFYGQKSDILVEPEVNLDLFAANLQKPLDLLWNSQGQLIELQSDEKLVLIADSNLHNVIERKQSQVNFGVKVELRQQELLFLSYTALVVRDHLYLEQSLLRDVPRH